MFEWSIDWLISKNGQLTGKFISQVKVAKSQPYLRATDGLRRRPTTAVETHSMTQYLYQLIFNCGRLTPDLPRWGVL